jgi:hypothetical protein
MYFITLLTDFVDHIDIGLYSLTAILSEIFFLFSAQLAAVSSSSTHDVATSVANMYSKRNRHKIQSFRISSIQILCIYSIRIFHIKL